jgi:hypothetical protein
MSSRDIKGKGKEVIAGPSNAAVKTTAGNIKEQGKQVVAGPYQAAPKATTRSVRFIPPLPSTNTRATHSDEKEPPS